MITRSVNWLARHWLLLLITLWGIFIWLPWLAPVFMQLGWETAAARIYMTYSVTCHQMPQRSFFLFGEQRMYELTTIQQVYEQTSNPLVLRRFIGTPLMGWKVAWSDRMVSFYGGIWLWMLTWYTLPVDWRPRLSLAAFILLAWPMVLDGTTHMMSDVIFEIGLGFRDTNVWLSILTGNVLPATFYQGDRLGSFNSWMRLTSGLLFSFGLVGWGLPLLHREFI